MAATTELNAEATYAGIKASLNRTLLEAAEPLLQAALKNIEFAMRERMAQQLLAHIDATVSMARKETDLVITIKGSKES